MTRYPLLLLCCAGLLAGCGGAREPNVDPDQAGRALRKALDAWKDGKTAAELEAQQAILMNESDWTSGKQLVEYKMNDAGALDGRQVKWVVQIRLKDKAGK